ncbi:hypothetical protein J6590_062944 [Homalodisca vitripennis]|nr:hypothetical protein J6590_062944 [Homalodisca vitripennis]
MQCCPSASSMIRLCACTCFSGVNNQIVAKIEIDRLLGSELDDSKDEVISSADGFFVDGSDEDPSCRPIYFISSSDSDERKLTKLVLEIGQ